ncbi:MAG: rhamnose ABC transporter substrate-binding protein [Chlamydiae bacterium]|nr:MAG: rhamnose ABC transporter substrate-binding protein [Chlamydiota bacterium]
MKKIFLLTIIFANLIFANKTFRVGLVPKSLGNAFFEAVRDGGLEAAKETGDIKIIFNAPATATTEGQAEVIKSLIAQHVDLILVSANDPDALVPVCKKAMRRKIKVISFDSAISPNGRILHIAPADTKYVAEQELDLILDALGSNVNEIAILSETPQSSNQNEWILLMKELLKSNSKYKNLKLVEVAYGGALPDKSYREAISLMNKYPDLKGILSPTTIGVAAAAKAVVDQKKVGKIYVTGLGLPSEMAPYVHKGAVKSFHLWNPIDLGYATIKISHQILNGKEPKPGVVYDTGRTGKLVIDKNNNTSMCEPFIFNKSNIDKYSKIF